MVINAINIIITAVVIWLWALMDTEPEEYPKLLCASLNPTGKAIVGFGLLGLSAMQVLNCWNIAAAVGASKHMDMEAEGWNIQQNQGDEMKENPTGSK